MYTKNMNPVDQPLNRAQRRAAQRGSKRNARRSDSAKEARHVGGPLAEIPLFLAFVLVALIFISPALAQEGEAKLRMVHLSPDAPAVTVEVDGDPVKALSSISYKDATPYLSLPAGPHEISVYATREESEPVLEVEVSPESGKSYTIAGVGLLSDGTFGAKLFEDEPRPPKGDNKAKIRVVHAIPDVGPATVSVAGGPRLFALPGFANASDYARVDSGAYTLDVTPAGAKKPAFSVRDVKVEKGETYTAFAIGEASEGTFGALVTEDSAGGRIVATQGGGKPVDETSATTTPGQKPQDLAQAASHLSQPVQTAKSHLPGESKEDQKAAKEPAREKSTAHETNENKSDEIRPPEKHPDKKIADNASTATTTGNTDTRPEAVAFREATPERNASSRATSAKATTPGVESRTAPRDHPPSAYGASSEDAVDAGVMRSPYTDSATRAAPTQPVPRLTVPPEATPRIEKPLAKASPAASPPEAASMTWTNTQRAQIVTSSSAPEFPRAPVSAEEISETVQAAVDSAVSGGPVVAQASIGIRPGSAASAVNEAVEGATTTSGYVPATPSGFVPEIPDNIPAADSDAGGSQIPSNAPASAAINVQAVLSNSGARRRFVKVLPPVGRMRER